MKNKITMEPTIRRSSTYSLCETRKSGLFSKLVRMVSYIGVPFDNDNHRVKNMPLDSTTRDFEAEAQNN